MATIVAAAGGGNWTAGGTWVGGNAPTAADDAQLTSTSGNVTVDAGAVCRSLDCNTYTGTLTHTAGVTLTVGDGTAGAGNRALRLVAGMTYALGDPATSSTTFVSTSATLQTVTFGTRVTGDMTFNGAGGKWQLQDGLTAPSMAMTLVTGTLDTNNQTLSVSKFSANGTLTRTLTLGSSSITCSFAGGSSFIGGSSGAITITANTATAIITGANASFSSATLNWGGLSVIFSGSGTAIMSTFSPTLANITRTGTAVTTDALLFPAGSTVTITGTLTVNGNSAANRVLIGSSSVGSTATINAAVVSVTNADFMDIAATGAAVPFTGTSIGDGLGNTGITFDAPVAQTWSGNTTGSWSNAANWTSRVPLPQDNVSINALTSGTITVDMPRLGVNVDFTGSSGGTANCTINPVTNFGNIVLVAGMTYSGSTTWQWQGRGAHTVTSAGRSFPSSVTINPVTGSYTLLDDLKVPNSINLPFGTFNANNFNVSATSTGSFTTNAAHTRVLNMGSGTWSIAGASAAPWTAGSAGLTVNAGTSTIVFPTATAVGRTFAGGGFTYNNLTYTVAGSAGSLTITGANTFNTINFSDSSNARTLTLPASTTTIITGAFNIQGTSGKLMTVNSSTGATAATLSKTGAQVSCDYVSLQDIAATGGASFVAYASTSVSGNSGWAFANLRTIAAGGGNWSATGTWAEGAVPTAADRVVATPGSGALTVDTAALCREFDMTNYLSTITLSNTQSITIGDATGGLMKLVSGMTLTLSGGSISFVSTSSNSSNGWPITTGGKTLPDVTFNGAGGSWIFQDGFNAASNLITLTAGTLNTNSQTVSWANFNNSNSNTRTLTLGSSAITITGSSSASWNCSNTNGLTVTANTAVATFTGTTPEIRGGSKNWNGLSLVLNGAGAVQFSNSATFANITRVGTASRTDSFNVSASGLVVTGTLTITSNSAVNRVIVQSGTGTPTPGVPMTITAAAVSLTNVDFSDITAAGAAIPWTGTSLGDALGNSNITFPAPVTRYGVVAGNWSSTATWSTSTGGAGGASVPLCHDTVILDANSAAGTYVVDVWRAAKDINCTGFTRTLQYVTTTPVNIFGSVTLGSGMTFNTNSSATNFMGRGTHTITSAGIVFNNSISFAGVGGTYTLADAFTTNTSFNATQGILNTNGSGVTAKTAVTFASPAVINMSTSTFTLTLSTTSWTNTATINGSSSTITFSATSAVTRTFSGGGGTYGTLNYIVAGSTGALTIVGANSFGTINFSDASNARTLTLPSSTTTTIRNSFNVQGTAGKLMTVNSSTGGTPATLSKPFGIVNCDYLSLQDSTTTGGAVFYAGANSTNVSGNTGWNFTVPSGIIAAAGGGNWTTGGTWVGGVAPTAADNAIFTSTSGNVTVDNGAVCRSLQVDPNYTGTLTHTAGVTLNIGDGTAGLGNAALALAAGMTYTVGSATTSLVSFVSTNTTQQSIATGTRTIPSVTWNGNGGSWILQDSLTATTALLTLTAGTLNTNGQTVTAGNFVSSNSNVRTLTLGASAINLTGSGSTLDLGTISNLTFTAGTSTITLSSSIPNINAGAISFNNVIFSALSGQPSTTFNTTATFANLSFIGTANKTGFMNVGGAFTVTGTLIMTGNSVTNRMLVQSSTVGTNRTITAGAVSLANIDFMDITGAGAAAPFTGTSLGDCLGNGGITFDAPTTQTHTTSAGGSWSDVTKWTSRVPLPQDSVIINANTSGTITADMPRIGADITFTGFAGTADFSSVPNIAFGNWTNGSGMTITGTQVLTLSARSNKSVTSSGRTFTQAVSFTAPGATYTLADAFVTNGQLGVLGGTANNTLNLNNVAVTCKNVNVTGLGAILTCGSSVVTLTTIALNDYAVLRSNNGILNGNTVTFVIANATSNSRNFSTLIGMTTGTLTYTVAGSTGPLVFVGANTLGTLNFSDATNARTLTLPSATITTVTNFNVNGTSGKLMTVNASTPGSAATLTKTNGVISCDYLSIQDSTANGGAAFYAGANSVNVSGNTGWNFGLAPTIVAAAGGGNWTAGGTWVGGIAPTAANDVQFMPSSGNVTIDAGAVCRSLQMNGYTGTLTHTAGVTLNLGDSTAGLGNAALALAPGMTYTLGDNVTSVINFVSTSATQQAVYTNTRTLGSWTVNGVGSNYLIADPNTTTSTSIVTLTNGTLNTNSLACSWGIFSSTNSNVRTLTLSGSQITITNPTNFTVGWDLTISANLLFNFGTSTITFSSVLCDFRPGGKTYNNLVWSNCNATFWSGSGTYANVTFTGFVGKTTFGPNFDSSQTITGTLTINGNSAVNRMIIASHVPGTPITLTAANVAVTNADFMDITAAGAGSWNLAAITGGAGDCGGNTGITFTAPAPQTHTASAGGNWSDVTKWTSRVPLPQDNVTIDANTTGTITADAPRLGADINFTGFVGTASFTSIGNNAYGSWTNGSGMTIAGTQVLTLCARTAKTITSAGKQFTQAFAQTGPGGGIYTMADAFSTASSINISGGTFATANFAVTCTTLNIVNSSSVLNPGSSVFSLTGTAAGNILSFGNNGTITAGSTAQFNITNTSANARTVTTTNIASRYIPTLTYTVAGSTGSLSIIGGAFIGTLNFSDATNARTLTLPSAATVAITNFNVRGTAGKLMTVNASTPGSAATLNKTSGLVSPDYLSIQDSTATGGALFYAGANSTNVSGNTGWTFSVAGTIVAAPGGGNWTAGGTWVGGVAPTAADNAQFVSTSGNVTIDTGAVCRSLQVDPGYAGTLTHTSGVTLTIGDGTPGLGNTALALSPNMNYSIPSAALSAISFVSTSATQQAITSNAKTTGSWTIAGAGSSYILTDASTIGTTGTAGLSAGTLNTNSQACSWGNFSFGSATTRTLTLGASAITITGSNNNGFWCSNNTGLTVTANTAIVTFTASPGIMNVATNMNGLSLVFSTASGQLLNGGTFNNVTYTGTAVKTCNLLVSGVGFTATGTFTVNGNSILNRIIIQSASIGTSRTITAAVVSVSNADFQDMTGAGAGSWNLAAITGGSGDAGGNSGITFTAATPQTHTASAGGNWSDVTKWTSRVPLPQDNVTVDSSTTGTLTIDMPRLGADTTFTGFAGTLSFSVNTEVYGNWTNGSGMTISGGGQLGFNARTPKVITSAGKQFSNTLAFKCPNVTYTVTTYTLADNLSTAADIIVYAGTVSTTTLNVTCSTLSISGPFAVLNPGSSVFTLTSTAAGTILNANGNGGATTPGSTAQFVIANASTNDRTINSLNNAAKYLPTITYTVAGSTGGLIIFGGALIGTLNFSDASNARTLTLPAAATTTITNFNVRGTAGKLMSVVSSTPGSAATISKTNGIVSCDYLSVKDSTATGGAVFYAGANSTNVSGNTGWNFTVPAGIIAAAGGGNWTAGGTWVGGVAPTAADNAVFTATSGNVTIDTGALCRSLQIDPGYAGTVTHTAGVTLTIGDGTAGLGNTALALGTGMTYTIGSATTSYLNFVSTSATQQAITTNTKTIGSWTVNGVGGSYILTDTTTTPSASTMSLTGGTLNTNNQICNWGALSSTGSTLRTLTLGSSIMTLTAAGSEWVLNGTNVTLTANTANITLTGTAATFTSNAVTYGGTVSFTGSSAAGIGGTSGVTFANLIRTGTATKTDTLFFNVDVTISGTLTLNGNSILNRLLVQSGTAGTARTLTAATVSVTNSDFMDITGAGAGSWNLAAISGGSGDAKGNSAITFTTAAPQTHTASSGGNWSDATKWTSRVPLPQDNVTINSNTTGTIVADMSRLGANIDFTGFVGTADFSSVANSAFGSWTNASGMTFTGTQGLTLCGRSALTITSAGKQFSQGVTITAPNATYTMADAFSSVSNFSMFAGTFATANFSMTVLTLQFNGSTVVFSPGSSTINLTLIAATNIIMMTNSAAITAGNTAQYIITNASANTRTIATTNNAGRYLDTITYTVAGSTGALSFAGSTGALIGTLNFSDANNARTLSLVAGGTFTFNNFNVTGTAGKLMTINSLTPGSAGILSKPTGVASCDYLSIQDSTATGGASWYAGTHSTNVSGNTGWIFSIPPNTQASFLGFFAE